MARFGILGLLAVSAGVLGSLPVAAYEASTTRIEPRVFYGATVTIEEGVRVFRPLPPHRHVVINPEGRAPVSLGFNESVEKSYNYYYDNTGAAGGPEAPVFGGAGVPFVTDGGKHRGDKPKMGMDGPPRAHHGHGHPGQR